MFRPLLAAPSARRAAAIVSLLAASLPSITGRAAAQAPKPAPAIAPRLPGAIESAPAWLQDAPFDVAGYFAMPPAAENAAPLYLEALAEFGAAVEMCFPPDRRAAIEANRARRKQMTPTFEAWSKDPASVPARQVDATLAGFAEGFRKLDQAQARPRCAFATGLTLESILPHVDGAREVARLLAMQAGRSIDRDDFPAASRSLERLLRLARDLRPRGGVMGGLVAIALDRIVVEQMLPLFLGSRKLKPEHCDRLLKILAEHEAQSLDAFRTAVSGEYVLSRTMLRALVDGLDTAAGPDGRPVDAKLDPAAVQELARLVLILSGGDKPSAGADTPEGKKQAGEALDRLRRDAAATRAALDDDLRSLLAAPATYPGRMAALKRLEQAHPPAPHSFESILLATQPAFIAASARDVAQIGAARCLVTLRRWQMTSTKPPADLLAVCKAAKLPAVPADPFGDGPLKLATVGDALVIYSVGPDGRDDRGQVEAELGKKPTGDLIYRLPKRK